MLLKQGEDCQVAVSTCSLFAIIISWKIQVLTWCVQKLWNTIAYGTFSFIL